MDHRIIKAGFREPRFIRKKGEDELDKTRLLLANLRFCNKHFLAGKERRARVVSVSYGNQAQSNRRFLGRIGPAELSFGLPAWTANTSGGQENQSGSPVFHPDANHALLPWACHVGTGPHPQPENR